MEEATGLPAGTLHRVLELRPGGKAGRDADNPLEADLVVVDEVSMLDALLANQLVKAVPRGAHLLLVGDPDQLPSVGAGDVLADLLRSERFPVTRLKHVFRQGAGSGIARNARRVNAGEMPRFGGDDHRLLLPAGRRAGGRGEHGGRPGGRAAPARYGFEPGEVQVLSPMHRGEAGVGALNTLLQERLNPWRDGMPEARGGGRSYRPGDRVLQLSNDYDLGVFNGDLGTVEAIDPTEQELLLRLDDGREVRYPYASLFALTHAYAISVHKAQGAEFPAVVIPLVTSHAPMLGRTLLYTALTRARQLVVIVGQKKALSLAVRDWRRAPRHTALGGLLDGTLRFAWARAGSARDDGADAMPPCGRAKAAKQHRVTGGQHPTSRRAPSLLSWRRAQGSPAYIDRRLAGSVLRPRLRVRTSDARVHLLLADVDLSRPFDGDVVGRLLPSGVRAAFKFRIIVRFERSRSGRICSSSWWMMFTTRSPLILTSQVLRCFPSVTTLRGSVGSADLGGCGASRLGSWPAEVAGEVRASRPERSRRSPGAGAVGPPPTAARTRAEGCRSARGHGRSCWPARSP